MHGNDELRHGEGAALFCIRQIPYFAQCLVWQTCSLKYNSGLLSRQDSIFRARFLKKRGILSDLVWCEGWYSADYVSASLWLDRTRWWSSWWLNTAWKAAIELWNRCWSEGELWCWFPSCLRVSNQSQYDAEAGWCEEANVLLVRNLPNLLRAPLAS